MGRIVFVAALMGLVVHACVAVEFDVSAEEWKQSRAQIVKLWNEIDAELKESKDPVALAIKNIQESKNIFRLDVSVKCLWEHYDGDPRAEAALKEYERSKEGQPVLLLHPRLHANAESLVRIEIGEHDFRKMIDTNLPQSKQVAQIVALFQRHSDKKERDEWISKYREMVRMMLAKVAAFRKPGVVHAPIPVEPEELSKRVDALIEDRQLVEDNE